MNFIQILSVFFLIVSALSCSKEKVFQVEDTNVALSFEKRKKFLDYHCANSVGVAPKVNFLFMRDDSHSGTWLPSNTRAILEGLPRRISRRIETQVYERNLHRRGVNSEGCSGDCGISETVLGIKAGFDHYDFSATAHKFIFLASNQDDQGGLSAGRAAVKINDYLRDEQDVNLNRYGVRFFSVVPHRECNDLIGENTMRGPKSENPYAQLSRALGGNDWDDTFDLCGNGINDAFAKITRVINELTEQYVYQYWKVPAEFFDHTRFDLWTMTVTKYSGQGDKKVLELCPEDVLCEEGFRHIKNYPTGLTPREHDPEEGPVIELLGDDRVTFPGCVKIEAEEICLDYRYISLEGYEVDDVVEVTLRDERGPRSILKCTNGDRGNCWTPVESTSSREATVRCGTNESFGQLANGPFLELHGQARYSNKQNTTVTVTFGDGETLTP